MRTRSRTQRVREHRVGDPLQFQLAHCLVDMAAPGPGHRLGQRRDQRLARCGQGAQPRRLHHWDPEPVAVFECGVAAGHPDPQTDRDGGATAVVVCGDRLHVGGRVHRRGRRPERRHDPVAHRLDHLAGVTHHDGAQPLQVLTPQRVPRLVAQRRDQLGGTHHVGEHHRHSAGTAHELLPPQTPAMTVDPAMTSSGQLADRGPIPSGPGDELPFNGVRAPRRRCDQLATGLPAVLSSSRPQACVITSNTSPATKRVGAPRGDAYAWRDPLQPAPPLQSRTRSTLTPRTAWAGIHACSTGQRRRPTT